MAQLPKNEAERIGKAEVEIVATDAPLGFSTISIENGLMTLSVGGLRTEAMLVEATLIQGLVDDGFLVEYLMYLRRHYLSKQLGLFPADVIGLAPRDLAKHLEERYMRADKGKSDLRELGISSRDMILFLRVIAVEMTIQAYMFTLAHESAHLIARDQIEPLPGESRDAHRKRILRQEERADEYAVTVMRRSGTSIVPMASVFWGTFEIYEPRAETDEENPHPPDNWRYAKLLREVAKEPAFKSNPFMTKKSNIQLLKDLDLHIYILSDKRQSADLLLDRDAAVKRFRAYP